MLFGFLSSFLSLRMSTRQTAASSHSSACGDDGGNSHGALRFGDGGVFHLAILEDLHFGENAWDAWGPQHDTKSVNVIHSILKDEMPDLVVLNGDLITGENTFKDNSTSYLDQIVDPIVSLNLTWASTYGNHDSDYNLSRQHLFQREKKYGNSRTQSMVLDAQAGVSNYYLPVYEAGECDKPSLLLWFFDSRGGNEYQKLHSDGSRVGIPNWVDQSVVEWFRKTNADLVETHGKIPSLAFVHIPTQASRALQDRGMDRNLHPGINDDPELAQQSQGWCQNGTGNVNCGYGGQDVPFMEALTSTQGLMAVFSGHDHGDTWCYKWEGVLSNMAMDGNGLKVCFGQRTGYGGYGSWIRGSRQVLVTLEDLGAGDPKNSSIETYIRMETLEVVGQVSLNSTYGDDMYPEVPNYKTSTS